MLRDLNGLRTPNSCARIILSVLLLLSCFHQATLLAQSVVLTWSPSTDPAVAGYKIYSGTVSHSYTNAVAVGLVTNTKLSGLAYGTTYYFAATTYDNSGNESAFSNEAIFSVPSSPGGSTTNTLSMPTLNPISDVTVTENAAPQTISLTGISASGSAGVGTNPQLLSGGGGSTLQITAQSSNPGIIPTPLIDYTSPDNTGTLTFQPAANVSGTSTVMVTVDNGQPSNNIVSQSFIITVAPGGPGFPEISTQPTNIMIVAGRTYPLHVSATGQAPLQYQWQFDGVDIPWGTGSSLTLTNIAMSEAGNYSVKVSNALGTAFSATGVLEVYRSTLDMIAAADTANGISKSLSDSSTPRAVLTAAIWTGGQFRFVVSGINHTNYIVQASSDLIKWVSLETNASPFAFVDTNLDGSSLRFYRACQSQ
ncbi:MAG: immunoglobulin domain-containing protein [Verrucomicrobiota bacterium]|jgi:hypothetical protein